MKKMTFTQIVERYTTGDYLEWIMSEECRSLSDATNLVPAVLFVADNEQQEKVMIKLYPTVVETATSQDVIIVEG